ncbi:hypothetical protein LTR28_003253 [Elasticomyces elasticus]|nr:hypothetical protein LTR28_003253 [Elasticomyces elasticus]
MDYLGIVLVMWGSVVPSDYFGFHCNPTLRRGYWALPKATLAALGCAIATLQPRFRGPRGRQLRFFLYSTLGLSTFLPCAHGVWLNGWAVQNQRMSLTHFLGLGLLNITGGCVYAARVPERWFPRTFDVWGASHQVLHVVVLFGALSHAVGLVRAFDYWHGVRAGGGACA